MKDPKRWQEVLIDSPYAQLTKQQVFDYYNNPKIQDHILESVRGKDVITRQSFSPDSVVLRRKTPEGGFQRIDSPEKLWELNQKRVTEFHPVFGKKTDTLIADIDPGDNVGWKRVKEVAKEIAKTMEKEVGTSHVHFSGGSGFYIRTKLREPIGIDEARKKVQEILKPVTEHEDVTFGKAGPDEIRIDTTPMKFRGSVKAPYSLSAQTGLVSAPVALKNLMKVEKKDFTIENVVKKATHVLVTGRPGSGKTMYTQELEKELGLPVVHIDSVPERLKAFQNMMQAKKELEETEKKVIRESLADKTPHIIEGWQLLNAPPELLSPHRRILVDPGKRRTLDQFVARELGKNPKWNADDIKARALALSAESELGYKKFRGLSGTEVKRPRTKTAAELKTELLPHQQRVLDRIAEQAGLVVAHGTGTGKTLTSIGAIAQEGVPATVLVPAALISNYKKEIAKHVKGHLPVTVESQQTAARHGEISPAPFLIVDEAHRARNPLALQKLIEQSEAEKRMLLTASPVYNFPSDIAPLVNLAAGKHVLPIEKSFNEKYIQKPTKSWIAAVLGAKTQPTLKNTEDLKNKLQKWVDYHENSGGEFPDFSEERYEVEMSPRQTALHNLAWGRLPLKSRLRMHAGLPPEKKDLSRINAFQTQARQISSSEKPYAIAEESTEPVPKVMLAVDKLKEQLDKNPAHKALVYSNYLSTLGDYASQLEKNKIPYAVYTGEQTKKQRDEIVDKYNRGKIKAMLVSSAGGEGLDLKGTRSVQVLEPHWNEEKLQQVIGRAIRHQSHAHLPPEQRHVTIQRFESYPAPGMVYRALGKKPLGIERVLSQLSENKQKLNNELLSLLEREEDKTSSVREFAPGIPASRKIHNIPSIKQKAWELAIQKHEAEKAGPHWDFRLVDPKTDRAHSFAIPKMKLPTGKETILAVQQPTHTGEYARSFEGEIPKGTYGAGKVTMEQKSPIDVIKANADKIHFQMPTGEKYVMFRMNKNNWGIKTLQKKDR